MATNFIREDGRVTVVLGSGETSTAGQPFQRGAFTGIASETGIEGTEIQLYTCGVYNIPKTTGAAWTQGQAIYWNASSSKGITTDESGFLVGYADKAAASGDTTGDVMLVEPSAVTRQSSETTATLVSGTVTVTDARCTSTSRIYLTRVAVNSSTALGNEMAVAGSGSYVITARTPGTPGTVLTGDLSTFNVRIEY